MGEEKREEVQVVDIASLDTYHLLRFFIGILTEKAWQHMGLRMDPRTKEVSKDFVRASVAIDCVAYLVERLGPVLDDGERRMFEALLSDLRINFVRQAGEG
ncbi:MAG: DUF1844 domain-containing protein [Candidatus Bathyarchaeia archaeon]